MKQRAIGLILTAAIIGIGGPALAHHGIVNFDLNQDIELHGVITRVDFVNPHSWLYLDVTTPDGEVTSMRCEMRSASVLRRSGWSKDMVRPGARVTITGSPDRTDPESCYLGSILFADGSRMDRYGQYAETRPAIDRPLRRAEGRPNFDGDWAAEQRVMTDPRGIRGAFVPLSLAQELEPGAVPEGMRAFPGARGTPQSLAEDPTHAAWVQPSPVERTPAGLKAAEDFDPATTDNPRLRCAPTNILFDWVFESDINRIRQTQDKITMTYGSIGLERVIHLDGRGHPDDVTPSRAGHSIGRWEGDTLMVDTVGFLAGVLSADAVTLHSDRLHVVERFQLSQDGQAIRRQYVATDPLYFEGEYRGSDTVYASALAWKPYDCDDRSRGSIGDPLAGREDGGAGGDENPPWWMFWK